MNREYVPGITSSGTKHAKHDLSLDFPHRPSSGSLESGPPPNIIVRFNNDPAKEPLRRFLVEASNSVGELWEIVSRLGIPNTPLSAKLPGFAFAMANPQKVVKLEADQAAVVRMRSNRSFYTAGKGPRYPHCRHRFRMHPPGFKTVVGANLLLFWVLFNNEF